MSALRVEHKQVGTWLGNTVWTCEALQTVACCRYTPAAQTLISHKPRLIIGDDTRICIIWSPPEERCSSPVPPLPRAVPSCWNPLESGGGSTEAICKPSTSKMERKPPARQPSNGGDEWVTSVNYLCAGKTARADGSVSVRDTHIIHSPAHLSRCTRANGMYSRTSNYRHIHKRIHLYKIPHAQAQQALFKVFLTVKPYMHIYIILNEWR